MIIRARTFTAVNTHHTAIAEIVRGIYAHTIRTSLLTITVTAIHTSGTINTEERIIVVTGARITIFIR